MNFRVKIKNKEASAVAGYIVCGNSDYSITFAFDSEWAELPVKTARFVYVQGDQVKHKDVVFEGVTVEVPVLRDITEVFVGVFAGELHTTTPSRIACKKSILCGDASVQEEPTPDVYAQILELVNNKIVGERELPPVSAEDKGKALAVDENGEWNVTEKVAKAKEAEHANTASKVLCNYTSPALSLTCDIVHYHTIGEDLATKILGGTIKNESGYYTDLKYENLAKLKNGFYYISGHKFVYEDGTESLGSWYTLLKVGTKTSDSVILAMPTVDKEVLLTRFSYSGGKLTSEKKWVSLYDMRNTKSTVYANEADKVNGLEIKRDENGVLKIGDIIIPQKKLIYDGSSNTTIFKSSAPFTASLGDFVKKGDKIEIVVGDESGEEEYRFTGVHTGLRVWWNEIVSSHTTPYDSSFFGVECTVDGALLKIYALTHRYYIESTSTGNCYEEVDVYNGILKAVYKIIE